MHSNKNGKHDTCLKDSNNKINENKSKLKIEEKKSGNNSAHSKIVTSSPKQKLRKEKKDSFNDLNISYKYDDKMSKELNFDSKNNSVSTSASEEDKDTGKSSSRKKDKTVDLFEERIEKKKQRAVMYEKYLQRGGARNPGSKEIPTVRNFLYNNNIKNNSERNVETVFR